MIAQLITRLTNAGTDYETIRNAWSLDGALNDINDSMPIALFHPGEAKAELSPALPIRQRVTEMVMVMTICKWSQLDGLKAELYAALLGYQHTPGHTGLELQAGGVRDISGEVVQWVDTFITSYWINGTTS